MDRSLRIPVAEEEFAVGVEGKSTGRVRIRTVTGSSEEIATAELERTDVDVERVTIGRVVEHAPPARTEGDVTIIPVLEEILVVEKRLLLKEEIRITSRCTREEVKVPVTLRKQEVVVERDVIPPEEK